MSDHLPNDVLLAPAAQALPETEARPARLHLAACEDCRRRLAVARPHLRG